MIFLATSLAALLTMPRFSDLKVLSTHKSLERPVYSVEITETPDVASYIPKHPIILTTAMVFKDDQTQLKTFIDSLVTKEVAALGIKVGRFVDHIDQEIIDYASQVDLPLLRIPSSRPLGTLLYQMLSYIWNAKTEQMTYALDIQKNFSRLLMHDVSSGRFVSELGKIIKVPVILLSPWHKVVSHSHYFSDSNHPVSFYTNQITSKNYQAISQEKSSFIIHDMNGNDIQVLGYPVHVSDYFPYHLIILNPELIPYPISEFAIDQAVLVLTFMMYKNQKVTESFEALKTDFFTQIINTKTNLSSTVSAITSPQHWLEIGANYGLVKSDYYQVAIAHCIPKKRMRSRMIYQKEAIEIVNNWLQEKIPAYLKDVIIFKLKSNNQLVMIFQSRQKNVDQVLNNLATELNNAINVNLRFSLGNAYSNLKDIVNSFVEAQTAVDESDQTNRNVNYYRSKGLIGLFDEVASDRVHYFCQKTLNKLAYPTEPALKDLRKTLRYYLSYNCEITHTAEALYLHRNTIKYRIKQCEKLLGVSIKEPQTSLSIRLALELSANENQSDLLHNS